jgi:hypothetical protein
MDLINRDTLKILINLLMKKSSFDQETLKSIQEMKDDDYFPLIYNDMLAMNKYKSGIYNDAPKVIGSTVKSSPYEKLIVSYLEYLIKKSNESESYEKIPYLKSIEVFVNWLNSEVLVYTKK